MRKLPISPRASFTGNQSDTRSAATWQTIEEYDEATQMPTASYIHGNYLDEVLSMRRADGSGIVRDYYYHQDDLFNVTLVTDASGAAVERYDYGDYGTPRFFDGAGAALGASTIGNPRLFNGRAWGAAVALYYYRTRYLDPSLGRFTARDTIGVWGDEENAGNEFAYVGSSPIDTIDPFGEARFKERPGTNKNPFKARPPSNNRPRTPKFYRRVNNAERTIGKHAEKGARGVCITTCLVQEAICSKDAYDDFGDCADIATGFSCSKLSNDYIDQCEWDHALAQAECGVKAAACAAACFNPITRVIKLVKSLYDWLWG